MAVFDEKAYCDGLSASILKSYACADDTDAGVQATMRGFIPDTTGTVTVRLASGGTTIAIPVAAGAMYPFHGIYSFDATGTDSTNVLIYG